ncbi:DUF1080 domain-containing protein [bacterium]
MMKFRCALTLLFLITGVIKGGSQTLSASEEAAGWKLLFDGKTSRGWKSAKGNAFPKTGWTIEEGVLIVQAGMGGGDIVTTDQYGSFELSLEFRLTTGANSGIKYCVQPATSLGLEYQLLDDEKHPDAQEGVRGNRTLASLYDLIPAENREIHPPGKWNHVRLLVKENHVEHWLNGKKVVEYETGTQIFRALLAKSKYKDIPGFGLHEMGHILLQDHGDTVSFRNIKIRTIQK